MIRLATINDAETLTALSMQSKRHWKYPEAHYEHWRTELTVSPAYIEQNDVFVYERRGTIIGYYSLATLEKDTRVSGVSIEKGCWLDHLFVLPGYIGQGIGSTLFAHMARWCTAEGIAAVKILADPNSRGFYEKMGCLPE
jgi:GNAT superfamily N-acetyltransferase